MSPTTQTSERTADPTPLIAVVLTVTMSAAMAAAMLVGAAHPPQHSRGQGASPAPAVAHVAPAS